MKTSGASIVILLAVSGWLAAPRPAGATIPLQKQALDLGYPADDCSYCHSFGRDHMEREARKVGLRTTNCITCHGTRLPLSGLELFNDRGRFLVDRKRERKAEKPDMAWLVDYVEKEPEAKPPGGKPSPDPHR